MADADLAGLLYVGVALLRTEKVVASGACPLHLWRIWRCDDVEDGLSLHFLVFGLHPILQRDYPPQTLCIGCHSDGCAFCGAANDTSLLAPLHGSSLLLGIYLLGNMSSFDTLAPCSAHHFGENTFRFLYAIPYKLGISDLEPVDTILPWINYPVITNTYTGMYPFYVDFGVVGVILFAVILGAIYGWTFKKAQCGSNFNILIYAVFSHIIITQYVADMFFTNISGFLKLILLLLGPFYVTKNNLLVCKEKVVALFKFW